MTYKNRYISIKEGVQEGLGQRIRSSRPVGRFGSLPLRLSTLLVLLAPGGVWGQEPSNPGEVPLTLDQAVAESLDGNRALEAGRARARAADLSAQAGGSFLLPGISGSASMVRTNDPVGVFGTRLRQGRFTEADFALPALNDPDAIDDWGASLGVQWDVGNRAKWVERQAAEARAVAAGASADRQREWTVFRTRLLYVDAIRTAAALESVEAAEKAAQATVDRIRRREGEGMATRADLLQAEASLAEYQAHVRQVDAGLREAREALGDHLGWEPGLVPVPVDGPEVLHQRLDVPGGAGQAPPPGAAWNRADLVAGRAGVDAARAEARAASAARLPAVQAFGMVETHAPDPGSGTSSNWTAGVRLSVPIFTGFQLSRGAEAAREGARALALEQDQREREARTALRSSLRRVDAARGSLESARAAATAADEAARLLARRYEEGMATVADLLHAEARVVQLRTGVVAAEADLGAALAFLAFTRGEISPDSSSDHEVTDHE